MNTSTAPLRKWKIGSCEFNCPYQPLPFKQAIEMLSKLRPQIRHTQMYESDGVPQTDGSILYEIPILPPKTNG